MTPLERAARALYKQIGSDFDPFGEGEDAKWPEFVEEVRAVIEAIRQPSEAMANRGLTEWQSSTDFGALEPEAADFDLAWKAMIDALLAEGP